MTPWELISTGYPVQTGDPVGSSRCSSPPPQFIPNKLQETPNSFQVTGRFSLNLWYSWADHAWANPLPRPSSVVKKRNGDSSKMEKDEHNLLWTSYNVLITHSPITLSNLSSFNLVSIFSPVYVSRVGPWAWAFSLSSHRHSYISLLFRFRFIAS